MSNDLKPFLMVINDETGDFVDIEMIQAVVQYNEVGTCTKIILTRNESVFSPLNPRQIWGRINVIRHKYGQQRRANDFSKTVVSEKPVSADQVGSSDKVPSGK